MASPTADMRAVQRPLEAHQRHVQRKRAWHLGERAAAFNRRCRPCGAGGSSANTDAARGPRRDQAHQRRRGHARDVRWVIAERPESGPLRTVLRVLRTLDTDQSASRRCLHLLEGQRETSTGTTVSSRAAREDDTRTSSSRHVLSRSGQDATVLSWRDTVHNHAYRAD